MKLFVYGSLKTGMFNNHMLGNSILLGEDSVEGFELRSLRDFPAINPKNGSTVQGEVYEVEKHLRLRLDRMEINTGYTRGIYPSKYHGLVILYYFMRPYPNSPLVESGNWPGAYFERNKEVTA